MTRIYEALMLSQQESILDTPSKALIKTDKKLDTGVYEKLMFMHESIVVKKRGDKYLHFIGLSNSHDEKTFIKLYARMLSENMKKNVAICMDSCQDHKQKKQGSHHEGNGSLGHVHEIDSEFMVRLVEGEGWNNRTDNQYNEFDSYDWVLFYSSMQKSNWLPLLLSKIMSDTVLILNSETIKYDEVENYIRKIKLSGGNLLGIVLNKMVPYIPSSIEKYL